jgi:hypothetical protein
LVRVTFLEGWPLVRVTFLEGCAFGKSDLFREVGFGKIDHFSSPGPKVQVNYCHHLASVICCLSSVSDRHKKQ